MELKVRGSSLEFRLHKLKFLDLLREGRHKEALEYSKQFARFASDHTKGKRSLSCIDESFHDRIVLKVLGCGSGETQSLFWAIVNGIIFRKTQIFSKCEDRFVSN